jgi:hypothetical protein
MAHTPISNWPEFKVRVAFTTDPLSSTPTWTDISQYARAMTFRRGRNHELDRIEAGSLRLRLNNRDRRFDPSFTAGPYYPNVLPLKRVRLSAIWQTVEYFLFDGFIEDWPQTWKGVKDAEVVLSAVDAFTYLSRLDISAGAGWPAEYSGARINRVLDVAGWPAGQRLIDAGQSQMVALTPDDPLEHFNALNHIQDVANSERGVFYMDGQGRAVFHDRHHRLSGSYLTPAATFGDSPTETPYIDLEVAYEASEIRNSIRVTDAAGDVATATDNTSITKFLKRSYGVTTFLTANDAAALATYLLTRYKNPNLRVRRMVLSGRMSTEVIYQALVRDLGHRIDIIRRPPPDLTQTPIIQPAHIEYVTHDISNMGNTWKWRIEWSLSPGEAGTFWRLNDTTTSLLGTSTNLAF